MAKRRAQEATALNPRWGSQILCIAALAVMACTAATAPAPRVRHGTEPHSAPTTASSTNTTPPPDADDAARARLKALQATECFAEPLLAWGGFDSERSPRIDRDATPEEQRELTRLQALQSDEHASIEARREAFGRRMQLYYAMHNWPRIARTSFEQVMRSTDDVERAFSYYALAIEAMRRLDRVRCEQHLLDHIDELHAMHCAPPSRKAAQCKQLDTLFLSARQDRIIDKVARADETNDVEGYRAAAEDYMGYLAAHCGPKAEPQYDRCEEIAYNAGTLFLITGQRDRAKAMLDYLQDPKNGLRETELARRFPCRYEDRPMSECEGR